MNTKDTRWKQRFSNLAKAFTQLEQANSRYENLSELEKEGLVQRFEYTFELAWKTLKDFLESKGVMVNFPREVIKEAFATGLVIDGELWMEMLDKRNLMAHTYEEEIFKEVLNGIHQKYFGAIKQIVERLNQE